MEQVISSIINCLSEIDAGRSARIALRSVIEEYQVSKTDESQLYYTVLELIKRLNVVDLYIKLSSSAFSTKKIPFQMRAMLRLATYYLKFEKKNLGQVYDLLAPYYFTYMNKKLLNILSEISNVTVEDLYVNRLDESSKISLQYFTPTWIVRIFIEQWGESFTKDLLSSLLFSLPTYIRVNTLKTSIEEVKASLDENNMVYEEDKDIAGLLKIGDPNIKPIPQLQEFKNGKIVIQQKASALVPIVLDPTPGENVLDLCASPGSKTSQIASMMGDEKGLVAIDIDQDRMRILLGRMKLLGVKNVESIQSDSRNLPEKFMNFFDKILIDPPCSSSGTFNSRPEIKWRLKRRDLRLYTKLQTELLEAAAKMVKNQGIVVYSTCSLFHAENHHIIRSFLASHQNFSLRNSIPFIGLKSSQLENKAQEIYPHLHDSEGFFIAKLQRDE